MSTNAVIMRTISFLFMRGAARRGLRRVADDGGAAYGALADGAPAGVPPRLHRASESGAERHRFRSGANQCTAPVRHADRSNDLVTRRTIPSWTRRTVTPLELRGNLRPPDVASADPCHSLTWEDARTF